MRKNHSEVIRHKLAKEVELVLQMHLGPVEEVAHLEVRPGAHHGHQRGQPSQNNIEAKNQFFDVNKPHHPAKLAVAYHLAVVHSINHHKAQQ